MPICRACPVPLEVYNDSIRRQKRERIQVNQKNLKKILADLTFGEGTLQKLGPAVNSGTSIFVYGAPGNGKTSVARAIGRIILPRPCSFHTQSTVMARSSHFSIL
jgi:DNA replication protein DnaC